MAGIFDSTVLDRYASKPTTFGLQSSTWNLIGGFAGVIGDFATTYYSLKEKTWASRMQSWLTIKTAERNADIAKKNAEYQEFKKRKQTKALLSRQRALFGKAGIELSGTAAEVMERTATLEEMDAQAIKLAGIYDVQNERINASLERIRIGSYSRAFRTGITAAALSAITTSAKLLTKKKGT